MLSVIEFKTSDQRSPEYPSYRRTAGRAEPVQYLGSVEVRWSYRTPKQEVMDVYIDFDRMGRMWYPFFHIYGVHGRELLLSMSPTPMDVQYLAYIPLIHVLRSYVTEHWWTIITRVPLHY